jgi:hypothetical protein
MSGPQLFQSPGKRVRRPESTVAGFVAGHLALVFAIENRFECVAERRRVVRDYWNRWMKVCGSN